MEQRCSLDRQKQQQTAPITAVNCSLPALPPASNLLILIIVEANQIRLRKS